MQFYEEGIVQYGEKPNWDYWHRIPAASLGELCSLALELEPIDFSEQYNDYGIKLSEVREQLRSLSNKMAQTAINNLELSEEQQQSIIELEEQHNRHNNLLNKIKKELSNLSSRMELLINLAHAHLEHGILRTPFVIEPPITDTRSLAASLYISDFVDWLDSQNIPYPEQMKNCMRMRDKPDEPLELTKAEKSKLSQENTTLRLLFNQMVKLHFGESVSAYEIAKHVSQDAKTIKRYLSD